ncbi:unnamed protein product, partial [Mesorhabditis belari]|uniref:S-protein homolog n=1 Tax=Mesorhabditis belari TaxID=2138241 RepID=A0AAF3J2T6_9BILA
MISIQKSDLFLLCFSIFLVQIAARKHRRPNEINIVNLLDRNVKLRCQSIKTDFHDRFLNINERFSFKFYDIDRGDMHFWCDVYALGGIDRTFDAFGGYAPLRGTLTWFIRRNGIQLDHPNATVFPWRDLRPLLSSLPRTMATGFTKRPPM